MFEVISERASTLRYSTYYSITTMLNVYYLSLAHPKRNAYSRTVYCTALQYCKVKPYRTVK